MSVWTSVSFEMGRCLIEKRGWPPSAFLWSFSFYIPFVDFLNLNILFPVIFKFCRCIPYRYKSGSDGSIKDELEVLVISSKKGQGMMFPKVVTTNLLYKIMNFNFTVHNSLPSN